MLKQLSIFILWLTAFASDSIADVATIDILTFKSNIFNNERNLRVYLPTEYNPKRSEPYPVLYMNDGQNLFSSENSMTGLEWHMDETASTFISGGNIPPMIIVGIDTPSYAERGNEYLPWPDQYLTPYIEKPSGSSYPVFLTDEVIPFIESKYNVGKSAEKRALGGSSYGGLITLFTALETKDIFSKYLIESPSFYVANGAIFKLLKRRRLIADKIYIGIGTHEGMSSCDQEGNAEAVDDMRRAIELMTGSFKLYDEVEECGLHSENDWARRLPVALIHLYGLNEM